MHGSYGICLGPSWSTKVMALRCFLYAVIPRNQQHVRKKKDRFVGVLFEVLLTIGWLCYIYIYFCVCVNIFTYMFLMIVPYSYDYIPIFRSRYQEPSIQKLPPPKKKRCCFSSNCRDRKTMYGQKASLASPKKNCSCLFSDQTMKFTEFFGGLLLNGPSLILTA